MKRWIRKLLAGLLSVGMLLQVASPLSALAEEDTSGAAQATPVSSLIIRDSYSSNATVTYTLNHYADGSVSWKNDKKPFDGIDVKYDTATSTFVFTGMLSLPQSSKPYVNLTCTKPEEDSIKLDGNGDSAVGAALTVGFPNQTRGAKNITIVTDSSSSAAIKGYATIDCFGDVTITNPSGKVTGGATQTAEGILVYGNAKNVTVTGNDSDYIISDSFSVYSKGNVTLTNPSGSITKSYIQVYESTGDVKIEGSSSNGLAQLIDTTCDSTMIKAKTLTMKNNGGPVGPVEFTGTDTASAYRVAVGESESNNTQTALTGTTYSETVNAKYLRISTDGFVPAPVTPYGFSVNGVPVTAENVGTTLPDGMTYDREANKLTASKDITGDLTIAADNTNTTLDVELKSVDGALAVGEYNKPGARNVTINGTVTGNTFVCVTGNIEVNGTIASEQNGADKQNRLDTTTGNITVTSDDAVWGQYAIVILKAANGPVTVSGNKPNEGLVGPNLTIWATETEISNPDGKINAIQFVPQRDGDYYINTDTEPAEQKDFAVSGKKVIYSKPVDSKLVISQTKPSIHQHTLGDWEHDETHHWKTCSGCNEKVGKAEHDFNSDDICKECGYKKPAPTPDHEHTLGDWEYNETKHWKTCSSCNEKVDEAPHNFGEDGKAEKCVECGYANPDYVAPAPDDTGTVDSGSDAGGAVAAVLVGSAAVWGGYEIATRVILHNILPEGTAIPANRGQLALLVWNNAGRPEPVNEPAFVDLDDAEMAKAAQWCVEQGIMDAKTAETFKPEGWTPKLKVIEVWNKAFPKQ